MFCVTLGLLPPDTKTWLIYQLATVGAVAATWIVLLGVAVAMAVMMAWIGREMCYFTYDFNTLLIFVVPAVAATLGFHLWLKTSLFYVRFFCMTGVPAFFLFSLKNKKLWEKYISGNLCSVRNF